MKRINYDSLLLVVLITMAAGWFTNLFWAFKQTDIVNVILGVAGIFLPIIGAFHGAWLWFA